MDGWLLVRGAEDDGDDCSGNSMVACLLAACLVAGLVWWIPKLAWLLRGCDLVRDAEDDGDDCSGNSMVFIVTTVATIV